MEWLEKLQEQALLTTLFTRESERAVEKGLAPQEIMGVQSSPLTAFDGWLPLYVRPGSRLRHQPQGPLGPETRR